MHFSVPQIWESIGSVLAFILILGLIKYTWQLRARVTALSNLYGLEAKIRGTRPYSDEQSLLRAIMAESRMCLGFQNMTILEVQPDTSLKLIAGTSAEHEQLINEAFVIEKGEGIVGRVLETERAYYARKATADPWYRADPRFPGTRSEYAVPIYSAGRLVGILDVQDRRKSALSAANRAAIENLADFVGRIWDSMRYVSSLLTMLGPVAKPSSADSDLRSTLSGIARSARDQLGARQVYLFEKSSPSGALELRAIEGIDISSPNPEVLDVLRVAGGLALAQEEPVTFISPTSGKTPQEGERRLPELFGAQGVGSVVLAPLSVEKQQLGMLALGFTRDWEPNPDTRRALVVLADIAALAIARTQLYGKQIQLDRERIAWELHHEIGQLGAISALANSLLADPQLGSLAGRELNLILNISSGMSTNLRYLHDTWREMPSDNLYTELSSIADRARRAYGIHFSVTWNGPTEAIPPELARPLRLAMSESLSNSIRHSRARNITFEGNITSDLVSMRIEDDGEGFDRSTINPRGLTALEQAITAVHGQCHVTSAKGRGTCVWFEVPIGVPALVSGAG